MRKPKIYQSEMWQKAAFTHRVGIVAEVCEAYIPETKMNSSADIFKFIVDSGMYEKENAMYEEQFHIIAFDKGNKVLGHSIIGVGSSVGTVVCVKKVIQFGILLNASSIVAIHNHPSGRTEPSNSDVSITKKLKDSCNICDLNLLDHIIITGDLQRYYSFADEGMI